MTYENFKVVSFVKQIIKFIYVKRENMEPYNKRNTLKGFQPATFPILPNTLDNVLT